MTPEMLTGLLASKCGAKLWWANAGALRNRPTIAADDVYRKRMRRVYDQVTAPGSWLPPERPRRSLEPGVGSLLKNLPRIHQAAGIQGGLQRPHDVNGVLTVLVEQILLLAEPDAVLAGAGAAEP